MIACACGNDWINERMASWTWMCLHVTGRANGPWNDCGGVAWATNITSGITNRMPSGNPVGKVNCNVGGCSCAGGCCWCSFLLIQSSQCWKQPSCQWTIKLFIHVSIFFSSLSCVFSLAHTHTLLQQYIHWSTENNTAFQEPMQHNHIHSMDHSLIQSHANTFTFNWPFTHSFSHYHRHMLSCHYINTANILL